MVMSKPNRLLAGTISSTTNASPRAGARGRRVRRPSTCTGTMASQTKLGSASLATDAAGRVVSEMRYTPYGETRSGALPTDRRYTGQRWDYYTQLYHMGARWYDLVKR